jgi:hypothetical protein
MLGGLGLLENDIFGFIFNGFKVARERAVQVQNCIIEGELVTYDEDAQRIEYFGGVADLQRHESRYEFVYT